MYQRKYYQIIKERINEERFAIQVIAGPRQVGKTTVVGQVLDDIEIPFLSETADSVDPDNPEWISSIWANARSIMQVRRYNEFLIVIDEIQKLNNWSEFVKKEWDSDTRNKINIKVILLGSSRLLIKKGLTESLAGRYELIRMGHWSFDEMRDAFGFDINQYIYYGGYPQGAKYIQNEKRWRDYIKDSIIDPVVSKDILMTTTIYKPALLKQLFELSCDYSGEILSLTKMIGQLNDAGNVTTLSNYIDLLSDCQAVTKLYKYANDNARKFNSIPKYQVFNTALMSANTGRGFEKEFTDSKRWGRWVESAVGAYLVGNAEEYGYKVYYWREDNYEVDFVLEKKGVLIAIEVKSGRRMTNEGIAIFNKKFSPKMAFVVGSGALSIEEFLTLDLEMLFD
ncbi:MAG: AAA family ATPase [Paludibacteraceae bacterium]|nr:AAA family ATPase [Paludibacteraceae bacterium]